MSHVKRKTISDFQKELMEDLDIHKGMSPEEINRYFLIVSDILIHERGKTKKTQALKNIRILHSNKFLFKTKKQRRRANMYVNTYTTVLKKYIKNDNLVIGGEPPACLIKDGRHFSILKVLAEKTVNTAEDIVGKDVVGENIKRAEAEMEKRVFSKFNLDTTESKLLKDILSSAGDRVGREEEKVTSDITGFLAKDIEELVATELSSAAAEGVDLGLEGVGFVIPTAKILGLINDFIICDPVGALVLCKGLFKSIKSLGAGNFGKIARAEELQLVEFISDLSTFVCENCVGAQANKMNTRINEIIDDIGISWFSTMVKIWNGTEKYTDAMARVRKINVKNSFEKSVGKKLKEHSDNLSRHLTTAPDQHPHLGLAKKVHAHYSSA